jgi:hypothetical protein
MIKNDGKHRKAKENTRMNRKAEGIKMNRTRMTKTKHKTGGVWAAGKLTNVTELIRENYDELKTEENEQNDRRRQNQGIQKDNNEIDGTQIMVRAARHRMQGGDEEAGAGGAAAIKGRAN